MTTIETEFWPFPVSRQELEWPEMQEKVRFLENATQEGCRAFRFGVNNYGVNRDYRTCVVLERGRNRWEIRLSLDEKRQLLAYLSDFSGAGKSLLLWCNGDNVRCILNDSTSI